MNHIILKAFEDSVKESGFSKKSGSWYLEANEAILLATLQKSQYGDKYYINLGVWMKQFGQPKFPKDVMCHIRTRLSSIVGDDVNTALDSEYTSMCDIDRTVAIKRAMLDHGIPFLLRCSSVEGVKQLRDEGSLARALVHKDVFSIV